MKKNISILLFLVIICLVPFTFAHPDTMNAQITSNGQEIKAKIIGLDYEKDKDESVEFLSESWWWQNFIWLLCSVIVLIMAITIITVYREDLNLINSNDDQF